MEGLNEALDFWLNEWSIDWMKDQAVFMDLQQGQVSGYLDIYNNVEKYEGKDIDLINSKSESNFSSDWIIFDASDVIFLKICIEFNKIL